MRIVAVWNRREKERVTDDVAIFKNGTIYYILDGDKITEISNTELVDNLATKNITIENARLVGISIKVAKGIAVLGVNNSFEKYNNDTVAYRDKTTGNIKVVSIENNKLEAIKPVRIDPIKIKDTKIENRLKKKALENIADYEFEQTDVSIDDLHSGLMDEAVNNMTGLPNCPKCGGKGYYTSDIGIRITCDCVAKRKEIELKPVVRVKLLDGNDDIEHLISSGLIKRERKDDQFSGALVKAYADTIVSWLPECGYNKESLDKYVDTLNQIIFDLANKSVPKHSYFVSAPSGFGKETFVNTCIKVGSSKGFTMVPYISLAELNELKLTYIDGISKREFLMNKGFKYTWSDYVNADLVMLYMASAYPKSNGELEELANIEFSTIETLLKLRAERCKPTMIFSNRGINVYKSLRDIVFRYLINIYAGENGKASYMRMEDVNVAVGRRKPVRVKNNSGDKDES